MGLLDKLKGLMGKAGDLAEQHEEKIDDAVDKAADFADDKTGGKHSDTIDKAAEGVKGAVDKLKDDDTSA